MSKEKKYQESLPPIRIKAGTKEKLKELAKQSRRELPDYIRLLFADAIIKKTIL